MEARGRRGDQMATYITRRALYSIPVIILASFLLFAFVRGAFDPCAKLRASRTGAAAYAQCQERLGVNEPLLVQYKDWVNGAVQGDLGKSSRTNEAVSTMLSRSMWFTVQLIFWGILLSAGVAISLGVYSAVKQYSVLDYTFTGLSFIGLAMPPFWFGLLAIQFLAIWPHESLGLDWFYFVGLHTADQKGFNLDYLQHLILPVLTLTVQIIAEWSRFQRASMLDVMSADYIRTARAKGVPRRKVIYKHGLRNALIPLVTVMALDIGALFGGLIITEKIFGIPGMGRLFLDSLLAGDVQVLVAWTIITAIFIVVFNLLADVLYGVLDPRIRLS
jgi:peptide/nickel transport system permease protein